MANLFDEHRLYIIGYSELNIIGDREKLAQWRHKNMGPAYYKLGRKVIYRGADLNAWAASNRHDPNEPRA
ncbi:MerR family transcriptional regulator [Aliishimia ponticola]|uniref:MerR family transcriptional regulator n=1 Tax=Aliishimia ponticola TaxID=2499833 RepID=A0A4S4NFQ0_9RHOB|nr:MerR family transcriptional regulator [Aliishimia ponticola]